ncbi:MAG: hypothetical protein ACHQ2F_08935, partial [Desulfobaccales bacterium]
TYNFFYQVYGKNMQSDELMQISSDQFNRMYFDNEGSSLYSYHNRVKIYTDLYIKRDHSLLQLAIGASKHELNEISNHRKGV